MTNDEINKENRDTLLDRMEASGGYHDQDQYPYGLMDEAAAEIKLLRKERDTLSREVLLLTIIPTKCREREETQ